MDFEEAVDHILKFEGGYVNDSRDGGGETKYGISKRAYPSLDIKNLTIKDAKIIYKHHYWNNMKCDNLPPRVRLMIFDCAVNQGVLFASRTAQKVAGVKADGIVGLVTIAAISNMDESRFLYDYFQLRLHRYQNTKHFDYFGPGWLNRMKEVALLCGGIAVA